MTLIVQEVYVLYIKSIAKISKEFWNTENMVTFFFSFSKYTRKKYYDLVQTIISWIIICT